MTRADLPAGTQACQAIHAAIEFTFAHPDLAGAWHQASNTVVLLVVPDELALAWLCDDAAAAGVRLARFHEPDLGGALTAAALEPAAPESVTHRLVSHLPLALTGRREVRT